MREGRYNWRHDSIIVNMAKFTTALKNVQVFADIDQYMSPSIIIGEDLRPDLIVVHQSKDFYVSEVAVGFEPNFQKFESNFQKNAASKYDPPDRNPPRQKSPRQKPSRVKLLCFIF